MPGLLAKAHRGILYVDDINLLDTELCQILLGIVADGWVNVEVRGPREYHKKSKNCVVPSHFICCFCYGSDRYRHGLTPNRYIYLRR